MVQNADAGVCGKRHHPHRAAGGGPGVQPPNPDLGSIPRWWHSKGAALEGERLPRREKGGGEGAGKGRRGGAEELHREERSVGVLPSAVFNFGCLSTIEKKPESTREVGNTDSRQTAAGLLRGRAGGWRGGEEADRERRSCRRKGPSAFIFAVVLVLM